MSDQSTASLVSISFSVVALVVSMASAYYTSKSVKPLVAQNLSNLLTKECASFVRLVFVFKLRGDKLTLSEFAMLQSHSSQIGYLSEAIQAEDYNHTVFPAFYRTASSENFLEQLRAGGSDLDAAVSKLADKTQNYCAAGIRYAGTI